MRIELSGAVQFANKNFVHRTISTADTFQASTAALSDDCLPADSAQGTRYRVLNVFFSCGFFWAFA